MTTQPCKTCGAPECVPRRRVCRECHRAAQRERQRQYREKHPERVNTANKRWRKKNPRAQKKYRLKYRYGLSVREYEALLLEQNHRCAICREAGDLVVDHDHDSGAVRGLLCQLCNKALGLFRDSPDAIRSASIYLERSRLEQNATG